MGPAHDQDWSGAALPRAQVPVAAHGADGAQFSVAVIDEAGFSVVNFRLLLVSCSVAIALTSQRDGTSRLYATRISWRRKPHLSALSIDIGHATSCVTWSK